VKFYFGLSKIFSNMLLVEIPALLKGTRAFSSVLMRRKFRFGMEVVTPNVVVPLMFGPFLVKSSILQHASTVTLRKLCALKENELVILLQEGQVMKGKSKV
jgi:hypothetical protein